MDHCHCCNSLFNSTKIREESWVVEHDVLIKGALPFDKCCELVNRLQNMNSVFQDTVLEPV